MASPLNAFKRDLFQDVVYGLIDRDELQRALKTLDDREQCVIKGWYDHGKTLRELGEELELSGERVRQIKKRALRRLRYALHEIIREPAVRQMKEKIAEVEREKEQLLDEVDHYKEIARKAGTTENVVTNDSSINDLDPSVRVSNVMEKAGLETVGDIRRFCQGRNKGLSPSKGFDRLLNLRNYGRKSHRELQEKLEQHGFKPDSW